MKKIIALVLAALLVLSAFSAVAEEEKKTIKIMATPTPHVIILEHAKDALKELGYELEIIEVTDYNIGNPATAAGEVDVNFFQHLPFLNAYNETVEDDEKLVAAYGVHCEPYGIYPGTKKDLKDIAPGDKIAVTNDPSNETRALLLLQDAGLIKLPEGATPDMSLQKEDIVETNGIEIVEMDAEKIPATLDDVAFAIINGNYVLDAGMTVRDDALFTEAESVTGQTYVNYLVVRPENEEAPWLKALEQAISTQEMKDFILQNESFAGGVIPTFEVAAE